MVNNMTKRKTFLYDNVLAESAPELFALQKRPADQLFLPGLDKPLPPFAEWVTIGIYSLLNPDNPTGLIRTTPTELLEILEFARNTSSALGDKETFSSDQYQLIYESLDLLFTTEIRNITKGPWKRPHTKDENKNSKKDKKSTKSDEFTFVFRGHILSSYTFVWPPGVTPPEYLPDDKVVNISRSTSGRKILKLKDGTRPIGIELQLDPRLVAGLTGNNIGATTVPFKIFQIRKDHPTNTTLKRLLMHVIRQTSQTMNNQDLVKLTKRLGLNPRRVSQNRDNLVRCFEILQSYGVVTGFSINEDTTGKVKYSFTKSKDWYLEDQLDQGQEEAVIIDGETINKEKS